jgi:stage III sporulation protein AE
VTGGGAAGVDGRRWARRALPMAAFGLVWLVPAAALAAHGGPPAIGPLAHQNLAELGTGRLDAVLRQISGVPGMPHLSVGAALSAALHGRLPASFADLLRLAQTALWGQVSAAAALLGRLVILAVAAAVLDLVGRAVGREEVTRLAATAVYLALVAMALDTFTQGVALARTTVGTMDSWITALLPLLLTLLAGMGAVTSAALLQPVLLLGADVVGHAVGDVAIPLIYIGGVMDVVGKITPYRLGHLAALVRSAGLWLLGGLLSLFLGVLAVAGSVGPVADGIALRSGKFLANAFVPVVGKMFSDATEMVLGSSLLLKNVIGGLGVLVLLMLLVLPVLKLLAMVFTYRLAGAAVSPVESGPVLSVLESMAMTLVFVLVAMGAVAIMCFLALAALLTAGSAGVLPG